jgi:tRNA (mo5U34)-methyltransferase
MAQRAEILAHPLWYHTLELEPGLVTPGWFDLRPIVERMPWPDVSGKRCLDVGTWDGFLAFELERRGASDVIATDIGDPSQWDWAARDRLAGPAAIAAQVGDRTGAGFELAKRALGSAVERREVNVYDLDRAEIGGFDVVVCGSLMLHLRDPIRALEAIAGVCQGGQFLSAEQIDAVLSLTRKRTPVAWNRGGELCQWWIPNVAAHHRMLEAAGFTIERTVPTYSIPFGPGNVAPDGVPVARRLEQLLVRRMGGGPGLLHSAALVRPA